MAAGGWSSIGLDVRYRLDAAGKTGASYRVLFIVRKKKG